MNPELLTAQQAAVTAIGAVERAADEDWKGQALKAVQRVALVRERFTTDAIWHVLQSEFPDAATHEPRALGAIMRAAVGLGICVPTDDYKPSVRVNCHARPVRVWRSLLKEAA